MAQHDYVIDNSTGANVRADINNVLQAIATNNSGSSAPSTTVATQFFADTSAGIMKLRNTANSGYVNLFTLAGGIDVDAASNFNEDVTFDGASADIIFDKSASAFDFKNNAKAFFGNTDDMEIFHDGSSSRIQSPAHSLIIKGKGITLFNEGTAEKYIECVEDGAIKLHFSGSTDAKFETTSTGVSVTGSITASTGATFGGAVFNTDGDLDTTKAINITNAQPGIQLIDTGANPDLIIQNRDGVFAVRDTTNNVNRFLVNMNNGNTTLDGDLTIAHEGSLNFTNTAGFSPRLTENAGGIEFYSNNNKRITFTEGGDFNFENNRKLAFSGSNQAMQLYHDGSNAYIDVGTGGGVLHLRSADDIKLQTNMSELMVKCDENAAVELYYDGAGPKFETTSAGVIVNGKYQQETAGGTHVYARQVFRESIAANATKTFTITGLAYGNVKITMGFGDGNFHYAAFAAVLGGNMFQTTSYNVQELQNARSGVNSITATKNNTSYAIAINAGTNQIFGSVVLESNNYDTNSGATLTIS